MALPPSSQALRSLRNVDAWSLSRRLIGMWIGPLLTGRLYDKLVKAFGAREAARVKTLTAVRDSSPSFRRLAPTVSARAAARRSR